MDTPARSTTDGFTGFSVGLHAVNGIELFVRRGGTPGRPPLLLLHGFPQSSALWRRVAVALAPQFEIVAPDLRGYGRSSKPTGAADHGNYSKRTMARDVAVLMRSLGHERYFVCGHDRGARVAHRLALDHASAVRKLMLLDIAPTLDMYAQTDMRFATAYYHWFHLIQPSPYPERMIGADALGYIRGKLQGWGSGGTPFIEPEAMAEYEAAFVKPETIHALCEDYRAAATIDLEHDRDSRARGEKIACDTQVLWGQRGVIEALFKPLALWQAQCSAEVSGWALPCGHYLPEEQPQAVAQALLDFMR
jgi:haloacetate dehalogenase